MKTEMTQDARQDTQQQSDSPLAIEIGTSINTHRQMFATTGPMMHSRLSPVLNCKERQKKCQYNNQPAPL